METRFVDCCHRAFASALELTAWAANVEVDSLKQYYIDSCSVNWFQTMQQAAPEFQDNDAESDNEQAMAARNPQLEAYALWGR